MNIEEEILRDAIERLEASILEEMERLDFVEAALDISRLIDKKIELHLREHRH